MAESGETDTVRVVEVVKLPSVRIDFAGEDNLGNDLPTKWRLHKALAVGPGVAVEITVKDAGEATVSAEKDESICQR